MSLRLQLAKPGKFGIDGTVVTEQALKDVVETFESEIPVTLGHHLADFMPAFGWVKSVEYSEPEKILYGDVELSDVLKEVFEQGLYKKWSVGIRKRASDGKCFLHHLAFLGAVPPKIKDLKIMDSKVINMADVDETWAFELSDYRVPMIGRILQRFKTFLAEKFGADTADNIISDYDVETLLQDIPDEKPSEIFAADISTKEVKTMPDEKKDEGKGIELADVKKKASGLEIALRNAKKELLKNAIAGKVPAAKAGLVMELADRLDLDESIELSDDGGTKRKVSAFDLLNEIFFSIPLPVKPGEMDMGDVPAGRQPAIDAGKMIKKV